MNLLFQVIKKILMINFLSKFTKQKCFMNNLMVLRNLYIVNMLQWYYLSENI